MNWHKKITLATVSLSAAVIVPGLLIITVFFILVLIGERTSNRWALGFISFIIWFLFYWFVKLLQHLLNKGKNATACIVAIAPAIWFVWAFVAFSRIPANF